MPVGASVRASTGRQIGSSTMPTSTKITTIAALSRRKARGVSGSGFAASAAAVAGSGASRPATAVAAASGHQAIPRAA